MRERFRPGPPGFAALAGKRLVDGEGLQAEPLSMAALLASLRRQPPWWLPASLLALGVAALGLLAGWPLSIRWGGI